MFLIEAMSSDESLKNDSFVNIFKINICKIRHVQVKARKAEKFTKYYYYLVCNKYSLANTTTP